MAAKSKLFVWGGLGIVILIAAVICYKFFVYQRAGLDRLQNSPQAIVVITNPKAFSQTPVDSPQLVSISADGYQPLVSIELWVNGKPMGVQVAPSGGLFKFDTTFLWSPGAPGEFSLVARTLDTKGNTAVSAAVLVNITPQVPSTSALADTTFHPGLSGVLPAAPSGSPVEGQPGPNESIGPAKIGSPSPGDWLTELTNHQPPKAPEVVVAVKDCTATLSIHDLSGNEEGFQVFRSADYAPGWTEIATLNSQSAKDWITYQDQLNGNTGQATYYVVAVNGIGQAKSNLAMTSFNNTDCPPVESTQQVLSVEPVSFSTAIPIDQAYCYKSLDGTHWERWPETGFFLPGASSLDIQKYTFSIALSEPDNQPVRKTLDLRLECWGWKGDGLKFLGEVQFTNDLSNLSGQDEQRGENFSLNLKFSKAKPTPYKKNPFPSYQLSDRIPFTFASLTLDPNACQAHLPPGLQTGFGAFIMCAPFPGYTKGAGTANPQPYLIWDVSSLCEAGPGNCMSLPELMTYAQSHYGTMQFVINELDQYGGIDYSVTPSKTSYVIDMPGPFGCPKGIRQFTVALQYEDKQVGILNGPYGPAASYLCAPPLGSKVDLTVTFKTLTLSNVNSGEDPNDMELNGMFVAHASDGSGGSRSLYNYPDHGCPGDNGSGFNLGTIGCEFGDGSFSIFNLALCNTDYPFVCDILVNNVDTITPQQYNNNRIHVTVGNGDNILLQAVLLDYDDNSWTVGCLANLNTESKTKDQWANTVNETYNLHQAFNSEAECNVMVTVTSGP